MTFARSMVLAGLPLAAACHADVPSPSCGDCIVDETEGSVLAGDGSEVRAFDIQGTLLWSRGLEPERAYSIHPRGEGFAFVLARREGDTFAQDIVSLDAAGNVVETVVLWEGETTLEKRSRIGSRRHRGCWSAAVITATSGSATSMAMAWSKRS
jgi:hypothetical protein